MNTDLICKHGILNDVTIRSLCVPPSVETYEETAHELIRTGNLDREMMSLVNGHDYPASALTEYLAKKWRPMIESFIPGLVRHIKQPSIPAGQAKVISFGTTSYGYDVRLSPEKFKIFTPTNITEIDPMEFDPDCLVDAVVRTNPKNGLKYVLMPAHSYALGYTIEWFNMPRDVLAICLGKSTYARGAVGINATPIEPGFCGNVVLELTNFAPVPVRIYLETGISQFIFLRGEHECETSYGDRGGKYQNQSGLQLPLV